MKNPNEYKRLIYIHPRSKSLSHVYSIKSLITENIAVSKEPIKFLRTLFISSKHHTFVVAANLDFMCMMTLFLMIFSNGNLILSISSEKTNYLHSLIIKKMIVLKKAKIAFVTGHVRDSFEKSLKINILKSSSIVFHSSAVADMGISDNSKKKWKNRKYDVLYFGRLTEVRGLRQFIQIATQCSALQFVIAGDGELRDLVLEKANELNNLKFLGHISEDIDKYALLSDSKILYSGMQRTENFGIAILEAVSAGAAVSCPFDYGPREILAENTDYMHRKKISIDEKKTHIEQILLLEPTVKDVSRFESSHIREQWFTLFEY
jgi:glycosyltransferase involved in cell wall biosynthesis